MEYKKLILILLVLGVVLLAGCSTESKYSGSSQPSEERYVGGGCGLSAPLEEGDLGSELVKVDTESIV